MRGVARTRRNFQIAAPKRRGLREVGRSAFDIFCEVGSRRSAQNEPSLSDFAGRRNWPTSTAFLGGPGGGGPRARPRRAEERAGVNLNCSRSAIPSAGGHGRITTDSHNSVPLPFRTTMVGNLQLIFSCNCGWPFTFQCSMAWLGRSISTKPMAPAVTLNSAWKTSFFIFHAPTAPVTPKIHEDELFSLLAIAAA